jgi:hypothetical protein
MSIHGRDVDPHGSLSGVLRAATAPAHPAELVGEQEAVAAFRVAQPAPRRSLLARILTVKAVIIAAAAVSTGVVVAATGLPWHEPTRPPAESPAPVAPASLPAVTTLVEPPPTSPTSSTSSPQAPSGPSALPSAGVPGSPGGAPGQREDGPGDRSRDRDKNKNDKGKTGDSMSSPQTPGSSARGAVTAAPPSGAKPPPQGG